MNHQLIKRNPDCGIPLESGEIKTIRDALISQATNAGRLAQEAKDNDRDNIREHWQWREAELMRLARLLHLA